MATEKIPAGTGKIYVNGKVEHIGVGFALSPRTVATACHVLPASNSGITFVLDGTAIPVKVHTGAYKDHQLDYAILRLESPVRTELRPSDTQSGARWYLDPRTTGNRPTLTGTVSQVGKTITNHLETQVKVLQLLVDQTDNTYDGYSGSAVIASDGKNANVIGILVEQTFKRVLDPGAPAEASNVLYALSALELPQIVEPERNRVSAVAKATAAIAALLLVGAIVSTAIWWRRPTSEPDDDKPVRTCCAPSGNIAPAKAIVQNTWEESEGKLVGVYQYPSAHSNAGKERGYDEGAVVHVVCQVRDGREVTDTPYRDRPLKSRVWDKLTNGYFISDIYTSLPKTDGLQPPEGISLC